MKNNKNIKIAIIGSLYRPKITDSLIKYCLETLIDKGIEENNIKIVKVPGALEIPLTAKILAKKEIYDAIIVFGSVFKGKTYHFEQVADECVRGCMKVSQDYEIPVVFEVLCVYDPQDALDRSSGTDDNRGIEGALTALSMIKTLDTI